MNNHHHEPQRAEPSGAEVTHLLAEILRRVDELQAHIAGQRKEYLTVEEVARLTGRTPYTVRRWVADGRLQATRVDGTGPRGRLLIPGTEMTHLIQQGRGAKLPPLTARRGS